MYFKSSSPDNLIFNFYHKRPIFTQFSHQLVKHKIRYHRKRQPRRKGKLKRFQHWGKVWNVHISVLNETYPELPYGRLSRNGRLHDNFVIQTVNLMICCYVVDERGEWRGRLYFWEIGWVVEEGVCVDAKFYELSDYLLSSDYGSYLRMPCICAKARLPLIVSTKLAETCLSSSGMWTL